MHQMKLLPLTAPWGRFQWIEGVSAAGVTGGWKVPTENAKPHSVTFCLKNSVSKVNAVSDPSA